MDTAAPVLSILFGIFDVLMWFALGIVLAIAAAYYIYAILKYRKANVEKRVVIKKRMVKMAIIFCAIIVLIIIAKIVFPILQGIFANRVV